MKPAHILTPDNLALGARVKALRLADPRRKEAICAGAGISTQTLWSIETGHGCRSEFLPALARTFGVTLDDLFGLTPAPAQAQTPAEGQTCPPGSKRLPRPTSRGRALAQAGAPGS